VVIVIADRVFDAALAERFQSDLCRRLGGFAGKRKHFKWCVGGTHTAASLPFWQRQSADAWANGPDSIGLCDVTGLRIAAALDERAIDEASIDESISPIQFKIGGPASCKMNF